MTFAFHHYSGGVLGVLIARLLGMDELAWGIAGFITGGFSDSFSWLMHTLWPSKYERWYFYSKCHPPYRKEDGHGSWDRWMKWIPMWGQHTWIVDPIIHVTAPRFIFPKFKSDWKYITWITIRPSHWNFQLSKWDVLYVILEASLWTLYTLAFIYLK